MLPREINNVHGGISPVLGEYTRAKTAAFLKEICQTGLMTESIGIFLYNYKEDSFPSPSPSSPPASSHPFLPLLSSLSSSLSSYFLCSSASAPPPPASTSPPASSQPFLSFLPPFLPPSCSPYSLICSAPPPPDPTSPPASSHPFL